MREIICEGYSQPRDCVSDFVSLNDDGSELPEEFEGAKDDQMHATDYMKFSQFGITTGVLLFYYNGECLVPLNLKNGKIVLSSKAEALCDF